MDIYNIKYDLAADFRNLISNIEGCEIVKVIELESDFLLQYWIKSKEEDVEKISDMAFMTWIKNPEFQKYYQNSEAFQKIAEDYRIRNDSKLEWEEI